MRVRFIVAALLTLSLLPFLPVLIRGEVFTLRDHSDYFIPLHQYTTNRLVAGELPFWNPLNGNGERWLANPQTAVFYPPAVLFLVLPFATAYVLFLAMHVALLAAGSYLLFRRWVAPGAAFLGAACLSLSGPTLSVLDVSNNLRTFAWIPLLLWSAMARSDRESRVPVSIPSALLALLFLGGEPFLAVAAACIYSVLVVYQRRGAALREIAVTGLLAVLLSMVQLIPFLEMMTGSDRSGGFDRELAFRESLHPADWALLTISPALSGERGFIVSSQSYIPNLYAGAAVVFLAVIGLVSAMNREAVNRRAVLAWSGLLAVVVVLAAGSHLGAGTDVLVAMKMTVSRYPARLVPLGALSICALAAYGAAALQTVGWRAGLAALVALVSMIVIAALRTPASSSGVSPVAAVLLTLQGVILLLMASKANRAWLTALLALVVSADLLVSARPLLASGPDPSHLPSIARVIDPAMKFARLPDLDRRNDAARLNSLPGYANLLWGVHNISTAAPVSDRRARSLHDQALFTPDPWLLQFMSVGYLLSDRVTSMHGIAPNASTRDARIHMMAGAFPMATLWSDVGRLDAALRSSPANRSKLEAVPDDASQILMLGSSEAKIRTTTDAPRTLVINQLDAPGWKVSIDGEPAPGTRVGGLFRAVRVPRGEHVVQWRYMPPYFTVGAVISLLTALFLLGMTIHLSLRERGVVGWRERARDIYRW